LLPQVAFNAEPIRTRNLPGIAAIERPIFCQQACLSWSITSQTRITADFSTDRRFMPTKVQRDLGLRQSRFQQR
jgi:hypothetical protein